MTFDCRSALYMPASNARALSKGPGLAADAIIIDLEDSVGPEAKLMARDQAVKTLTEVDYGYRLRALRINAADTLWYQDDVDAVISSIPDVLVLPKVESAEDIARVSALLDADHRASNVAIWAMMESAAAVVNAAKIAGCKKDLPRLTALLVGNNDLSRSANMPISSDRTYLLPWLMTWVAAAKANHLGILDGVYNEYRDLEGYESECVQGVSMGMDGKTLIHPTQIDIANNIFTPSQSEVEHALAVVAAFADPANEGAGVLQLNGQMIERLHLQMAQRTLARAKKRGALV
ncbi:MAG: CoA ester lyase [Granulosicoccus sp.]